MKSRSHRYRKFIWMILIALAVYLFVYPLILQLAEFFSNKPAVSNLPGASYWEMLNQKLIEIFFGILFFSFGASLGSFLNVVAYRMPLGRSVIFNPSKCPRCEYSIAMRDNIPVLGWVLLNGECRNCHQKISPRYPIVEGICGAIFLLLFLGQLISGGKNLPIREPNLYAGVVWIVLNTKWDMIAIYVYHCILFSLLLTLTLFAWDRSRVPRTFVGLGLVLLIAPPLFLNYIVQVPYDRIWVNSELMDIQRTVLTLACGGLAGLMFAVSNWSMIGQNQNKSLSQNGSDPLEIGSKEVTSASENGKVGYWHLLWGWILLGIGVGWQGLIGIALILTLLQIAVRVFRSNEFSKKLPSIGWLLIAALTHQFLWRLIHRFTWQYLE